MNKSTMRKLLAIAGCVTLFCAVDVGIAHAATTAQVTTSATVVQPLSITKGVNLNFGKFMPSAAGGTVVVTAAGAQSATAGVTTSTNLGATAQAATFTITGEAGATYAISYTPSTLTGAGDPMTLSTFTAAVSGGGSINGAFTVGTLPDPAATQTLSVGATLAVAASQAPGVYSGTLDVAVNYN